MFLTSMPVTTIIMGDQFALSFQRHLYRVQLNIWPNT